MKENSLAIAAGLPSYHSDTGDPDLDRLVNTLYDLWLSGNDKFKGWVEIQFDRAFPADVAESVKKNIAFCQAGKLFLGNNGKEMARLEHTGDR